MCCIQYRFILDMEDKLRLNDSFDCLCSLYPPQTKFGGVYRNHPVCLSVRLSVRPSVQSKLNLDYNFWTKGDRALILHRYIPCDKTFLLISKFLTSWPWPWILTYFWKNLTLVTTFEPKEIGLSYFTCVLLVARPSCWNQNFLRHDLDLDFWPTFEKNLTLTITFKPTVIGL